MFKVQGFSLLEILASLLILSVVLLGANVALTHATATTKGTLYFYIASEQIANVHEYLHAHHDLAVDYIASLQNQVGGLLPNGRVQIAHDAKNYSVTIYWGGHKNDCEQNKAGLRGCVNFRHKLD